MKQYPSIPSWRQGAVWGLPIVAFDKLDGSNIRFEWSRKRGWHKFGSRHCLIDERHEQLGEAIPVFLAKYGEELDGIFRKQKPYRDCRSVIVFGEFFGERSFAGVHEPDDPKDVVLFDVNPVTKGFLPPKQLLQDFGHLHLPRVVYQGNLNRDLVRHVEENEFDLQEGIIAKGEHRNQSYMVKVKTREWLERVKGRFGEQAMLAEL